MTTRIAGTLAATLALVTTAGLATRPLAGATGTPAVTADALQAGQAQAKQAAPSKQAKPSTQAAPAPAAGSVRHIVVFKYKPTATPDQIRQVTEAFAGLATTIDGITGFEHGVNNSPEKKNLGFTHVYQLTFADVAARDAYLPHPEHRKFGELLGRLGVLEDAFVVDYTLTQ